MRTAAEEAGLDLTPPARDLLEQGPGHTDDSDESTPERLLIALGPSDVDTDEHELATPDEPTQTTVSWDGAQERLDHEREIAADEPDESTESPLRVVRSADEKTARETS